MNARRRMDARICAHGHESHRDWSRILGPIALLAACVGLVPGCSQTEATPQVPLNRPHKNNSAAGGSETSSEQDGGSDSGGSENPGTTASGGNTSDTGAAQAGATSTTSVGTSVEGSSCKAGVRTGDACDPAVDTALCVRSTRDCTCGKDATWTCTNKTVPGGTTSSGGSAGLG